MRHRLARLLARLGRVPFAALQIVWDAATGAMDEYDRLHYIAVCARAYVAAWDAGDTLAHEQRAALRAALQETTCHDPLPHADPIWEPRNEV